MVGVGPGVRRALVAVLLGSLSFAGLVSATLPDVPAVEIEAMDPGSSGRFDLHLEGPEGTSRSPYLWFGRDDVPDGGLTTEGRLVNLYADTARFAVQTEDGWSWGPARRWESSAATKELVRVVDPSARPVNDLWYYQDLIEYQSRPAPPCLLSLTADDRAGPTFRPCLLTWPRDEVAPLDLSLARFDHRDDATIEGDPAAGYLQQGSFPDGRQVEYWVHDGASVPAMLRVLDGDQTWTWLHRDLPTETPPLALTARFYQALPDAAPRFELNPSNPWGPDDTAWPHLKANEAWTHSATHPEVQAFQRTHPGTELVFAAWEMEGVEDPATSFERWIFVVDDGTEALRIQYERSGISIPEPLLSTTVTPLPTTGAHAPSHWPTLTSVWKRFDAFSEGADMPLRIEFLAAPPGKEPTITAEARWQQPLQGLQATVGDYSAPGPQRWSFDLDGTPRSGLRSAYSNEAPQVAPAIPPTRQSFALPETPDLALKDLIAPGLVGLAVTLLYQFFPALKTGAIGLFSRLTHVDAQTHSARRALSDIIHAEPGIHKSELSRRSGMVGGQLQYHLDVLCTHDLLVAKRFRGYTCYFPPGVGTDVEQAPALRSPTARRIIDAVQKTPGSSGSDLAEAVGVTPSTLHYHTQRLVDLNLLRRERHGRMVRLWPAAPAE